MKAHLGLTVSLLLTGLVTPVLAEEEAAIHVTPEVQLGLVALTNQTLTESTTVTVQPHDLGSPDGAISEAWPEHCLLSVHVELANGEAELDPGKLVCITEDRRILESELDAVIEGLGACQSVEGNDCARYRIDAGEAGRLKLNTPAELTPQPKNLQS